MKPTLSSPLESMTVTPQSSIRSLEWADSLRSIATISVILLHAAAPLLYKFGKTSTTYWTTGNLYDSLVRASVPLFVMLTGALLLNKKISSIQEFLIKRLLRIVVPFVLWSLIYILFKNDITSLSLKVILLNFWHGSSYHLWYVYMIIGLYLFIPIIIKWVHNSTASDQHYFIFIWLFTLFIFPLSYTNYKFKIDLVYFSGYLGYLILGYYLSTLKQFKYQNFITITLFLAGFILTFLGTQFISVWKNKFIAILYDYTTINVCMMATGIFLFFKNNGDSGANWIKAITKNIAKYSYGIYLVHVLVLDEVLAPYGINYSFIHPTVGIPLTTLACLIISTTIIYLITKLPFGKYFS